MYKRIGLDVILRAERRGKGKINVLLFYLIPPQGVSSPLSGVLFCFFFFSSLNISVDRPRREPNRRRCCHPRHLGRPVRRLGGGRPPRRTLRWQCDRRGIDQASESSGHAATGFSQPCLSKIDPLNRLSRASRVPLSSHSPKTSIVPTSSSLLRQISIVHSEPTGIICRQKLIRSEVRGLII